MNFNPIDKEMGGGESLYFKRTENQHFIIKEFFRYDIWSEQTAFWLMKFI